MNPIAVSPPSGLSLSIISSEVSNRPNVKQNSQMFELAKRGAARLAPRFQVDPWWPKPLPNRWLMGQAAGVAVDGRDHIWVIQRPHADRGRAGRDPRPAALALLRGGATRPRGRLPRQPP